MMASKKVWGVFGGWKWNFSCSECGPEHALIGQMSVGGRFFLRVLEGSNIEYHKPLDPKPVNWAFKLLHGVNPGRNLGFRWHEPSKVLRVLIKSLFLKIKNSFRRPAVYTFTNMYEFSTTFSFFSSQMWIKTFPCLQYSLMHHFHWMNTVIQGE
jgi:hypothetical protein